MYIISIFAVCHLSKDIHSIHLLKILHMKTNLILLALPFLFACNGGKKTTETVSNTIEQNTNDQLKEKQELIKNYIQAFSEIQDNLNQIKQKEKAIAMNSRSIEFQKSNKNQILQDIQFISNLLDKNKATLTSMNLKFKEVTSKNNEMEKLNSHLIEQVADKEREITFLRNKLNPLNPEPESVTVSATKPEENTTLLNRVYFAIGTHNALKNEGLINEKGGVAGIGKKTEINPNMAKGMFNILDMEETKEISIAANEVKLITVHPADSYKLENADLKIKKLIILDPKEFWSISKYLIIQVSSEKPLPHSAKFDDESNHIHL
jgi:hypothetical protein